MQQQSVYDWSAGNCWLVFPSADIIEPVVSSIFKRASPRVPAICNSSLPIFPSIMCDGQVFFRPYNSYCPAYYIISIYRRDRGRKSRAESYCMTTNKKCSTPTALLISALLLLDVGSGTYYTDKARIIRPQTAGRRIIQSIYSSL